jgi:DNA-binding MarR family transcriptional regulator
MYNRAMNKLATDQTAVALMQALAVAGQVAEGRLEGALAQQGLSTAKLKVLREISLAGQPIPLGQLAERLQCAKSNITQMVDRLEQEGLVRRLPHDGDRRCMRAALTEKGQNRLESGMLAESRVHRQLLAGLSTDERAQLVALLGKFPGPT